MDDQTPEMARQWWIGITELGFAKWLTQKHPEEIECRHVFLCQDGSEKCVEYVPVIEFSAYKRLKDELHECQKLRDFALGGQPNEIPLLKDALNQIAMLGRGELAYTSDFTEQVMQIAHKALTGKDRGL